MDTTHTQFGRELNRRIGEEAVGYFDKNDIFAFAPPESGKIAPAQIKIHQGT